MSRKRKHDQVEPDAVPAQDDGPEPDQSTPAKKSKSKGQSRQEKSERRAKKKKLDNTKDKGSSKSERSTAAVTEEDGAAEKSSKKRKSKSKDAEEQNNGDAEADAAPPKKSKKEKVKKEKRSKDEPSATTEESSSTSKPDKTGASASSSRFIVFVGNLPFTATAAQVQEHFVKLAPSSVRLSTDKATGKGKGFAFVEFDGYDKMKTCLKLYHHSIFDPEAKGRDKTNQDQQDGNSGGGFNANKKAGRRINVELTAGGGGKQSKERRERIRSKNVKLDEERERTRAKERAEQDEAARIKRSQPQTGANAAPADNGSIHPSRLAQMRH